MDLKCLMYGSGEKWTEERHASFLNWIEESFVRRMLGLERLRRPPLRCCASNFDRGSESPGDGDEDEDEDVRAARAAAAEPGDVTVIRHDKMRKRRLPRCDSPMDQVVPQLESTAPDAGEEIKNQERAALISLRPTGAMRKRRNRRSSWDFAPSVPMSRRL